MSDSGRVRYFGCKCSRLFDEHEIAIYDLDVI